MIIKIEDTRNFIKVLEYNEEVKGYIPSDNCRIKQVTNGMPIHREDSNYSHMASDLDQGCGRCDTRYAYSEAYETRDITYVGEGIANCFHR